MSLHGEVKTYKLSDEELAKYQAMDKPKLPKSAPRRLIDWSWPMPKLCKLKGEKKDVGRH